MNADTGKLIIALDARQTCTRPLPIRAMYVLTSPREAGRRPTVTSETLSARESFIELVKSTFNRRLAGARRMERQFTAAARLTNAVPIRRLTYPRQIERLADIHDIVLTR